MKPSPARARSRHQVWTEYLPLLVLLAVTALAAAAKGFDHSDAAAWHAWMHDFMGYFLVTFAMLKLFDLPRFVDGFAMYDLLARAVRPYGFVYPFIELALGLGYLSASHAALVYGATVIVMGFGSIGVIVALRRGIDLNCACMGNILKVPLSVVALGEDLGMALMAAGMWVMRTG
ncbi:MAG TPA: MauE/DoxX family redox-associated membrane protein [Candidatus Didemnitutus sp.]|nr:MauE/DoxX family redox-associated membrane protein [Candidatus Didemnitutus sp.]